MKSSERLSSKERKNIEKKNLEKIDPRELRSLNHLDARDKKSSEHFDRQNNELKGSADTLDTREFQNGKVTNTDRNPPERGKSEEKPRERDDWKSLEKARKDDERRERDRQAALSSQLLEFRSELVTDITEEKTKGSVFAEYDPMIVGGVVLGFDDAILPIHNTVERTKSDPNPARQRLGSNSKRHMLTHQKSIDLTPADSGDEDAFLEGTRTQKYNVDIPYTLHKRHVMNGTASDEKSESENGKTSKNGVKNLAKDLLKLPLKSVADSSSLDVKKLIALEEGPALSPERPKSILISPDRVKPSPSVSGKNKSISSPVSKFSPTDQKLIVSNATPADKSPVKSGIKLSSNSQASSRSLSLDRIGSKAVAKDRLTVNSKSSSLDKKSSKLLPTEPNVKVVPPIEKKSYKLSPIESHLVIVSAVEKRRSPVRVPRSQNSGKPSSQTDLMDIVGLQIKQKLERREKEKLNVPDDSLEKQDSIENVPLPEIPLKVNDSVKPPLPIKQRLAEDLGIPDKQVLSSQQNSVPQTSYVDQSSRAPMEIISSECQENGKRGGENVETERLVRVLETESILTDKSKLLEKSRLLQKPSIPEKTKRILDKIESRFTEINKNSASKLSKPMIIDTGFDDFVDPVADLPLDEVPVKPALDSLKVPEFTPFISRPHAEPLRCKSLSLAEEKAPIDTLLSPELESKSFIQDVSPKKSRLCKSDGKKDFKKQSKSLEGDKPSFKKTASKELKTSPANSKVGKSKLKIGEMPQEIIIIDSTDVEPEISIVQKGRSKSVTRLSDRSFSNSKDEKDEFKKSRVKSTSVDDELIKGPSNSKIDKPRPKFLGISKSLGSTEKKDSTEKVSPKRVSSVKGTSKSEYCQGVRLMKSETDVSRPVVNNEVRASPINSETKSVADVGERKTVSENSMKKYQNNQELCQSSTVMRKPGQVPILFARARLGLSEGSGLGTLQRQGATQSPTAQRRAKSLDAPVISVHRLPPVNAFSSKDDTVDTTEELVEHEIVCDENLESHQIFKPLQSVQMEASPNHKSESTDHTTIPEMLTDSLSVTETSAQYLESPLTECNEIVICPDLIPYEQESQVQSVHLYNSREIPVTDRKIDNLGSTTKFIDQSSIESGAEVEALQENAQPKGPLSGRDVPISNMPYLDKHSPSIFEINSKTEFFSGPDSWNTGARDWNHEKNASPQQYKIAACNSDTLDENKEETNDTLLKIQTVKAHPPYIESTSGIQNLECTADTEKNELIPEILKFSPDPNTDTIKAFIQISIEECSDDELVIETDNDLTTDVIDINRRKSRLDSGDTSEDTLDAPESQVRGDDSEVSSPDYGVAKVDEKTLVEVQLTSEYLDMKKEDEKIIEALPEDEPFPADTKEASDPNHLPIERKLRLSTERSGSEETNTWTPDREDPDSSSCSIARPLGIGRVQPILDRKEIAIMKETRKDGSQEEESSSSSFPIPKPELSSTWKPFPLESSGSSSLEDGWFPPDDGNHHQSHSEDSNGQNEDSFQEDLIDFPSGFGYPMGPDILANYGGAFCLSRTLSRISERSTTSEQDKSEMEDSFKPSSRSPSLDDESLISSDHQPSLSSDPPSGTALPSVSDDRRTSSELPDIPIDVINDQEDEGRSPNVKSRLQLQASEEWPSPPSSPLFDTPVVSHVETFYMEIKPEEAVKVTVTDSTDTPNNIGNDTDSSDENRTLHDDLHSTLLEDGQSSMSATTVDGTVKITVKPKSNSYITGSSHSEDTSMGLSMSEWSSSNNTVRQFCQYSGTKSDDNSLAELGASISDWSGSTTIVPQQYYGVVATEKSQSDTTTSDKSITSMRPNSRCRHIDSSSGAKGDVTDLDGVRFGNMQQQQHSQLERQDFARCQFSDGSYGDAIEFEDSVRYSEVRNYEAAQFDEARKFVESQFDKHQFDDSQYEETDIPRPIFTDISPPQISFQNAYDDSINEFEHMTDLTLITDNPGAIPEESDEQLYDNVPAMKYSSGDQVRMEVTRGDSSEDMHERYASLASHTRYEYDRSIDDQQTLEEKLQKRFHEKPFNKFDRGYSESGIELRHGTKSTQRPVIVPIRAKSTPYYSTTSLSGESTTSSPPMQMKAQIRTKTMAYSSSRSPQSEGDTSSSMESPGHTPERGARAFRRKRQQNIKRRHRVTVDLELKDEQIVSSTDSSFDVANIPPPLLPEQSLDIDDEELFVTGNNRHHQERNPE
ncbi:uncharacterized protein LOC124179122 [Neodiprion fabricii]|uniref:uncharacterized protein LOC124179122 n=1 Tax=Neodiprion fabricii TaxID=2872261 RepID=UPI001ED9419A|nr:uncharacterized protein LOC124179122 [Neodiprion fabricii]